MYSVVVPLYNEEASLPHLHAALTPVMQALEADYEIVYVDDGSTDGSRQVIRDLRASDPAVRLVGFKANAGQTAAMAAGFKAARGDVVITLDADLQNDPRDIPTLLEKLPEYDAAVGWRHKRHDSAYRLWQSRIANGVRNWVTGESIADVGCSLKAYKRECLQDLKLYEGMHRFLPTLIKMAGYTVVEVPVSHRPRERGVSKYGMWNRVFRATIDLFAVRWMKWRQFGYEIEEEL